MWDIDNLIFYFKSPIFQYHEKYTQILYLANVLRQ